MIITCLQDLPRDYCLLCKEQLIVEAPLNNKRCPKTKETMINGVKHSISEYNYYLNVFNIVVSENLEITYKTWLPHNIIVHLNDQQIIISLVELDFSDLDKLQQHLQTLINFS